MNESHLTNPNPTPKLIMDFLLPIVLQEFRRLTNALGHILTVTAATAVVIALFLYVFHDFIDHQLVLIDRDIATTARFGLGSAILVICAYAVSRYIRDILLQEHDWGHFLILKGFSETTINQSKNHVAALVACPAMIIASLGVHEFLGPLRVQHIYLAFFCTATIIMLTRRKMVSPQWISPQWIDRDRRPNQSETGVHPPLIAWRATRLMGNDFKGAQLRVMAALPILFGTIGLALDKPAPLTQACVLVGGIILSWTVPIQIADDLKSTWIERQSAVSHEQWIKAWQSIFWSWAKPIAITTIILVTVSTAVAGPESTMSSRIINILLCGLLAGFPVWMAPAFVMQIDGRRVLTNIIMQTLLFVFAGTALMAIPWLAPALFIIHREAHKYQGGRFARGSFH